LPSITSSSRNSRKINIKTAFPALIRELKVYTTVDLDKEAKITLRFRPTDEVIDSLNRLMRGDEEVMVAFVPLSNENKREIPKGKQSSKGTEEGVEV
jgi:hypothetical protein